MQAPTVELAMHHWPAVDAPSERSDWGAPCVVWIVCELTSRHRWILASARGWTTDVAK